LHFCGDPRLPLTFFCIRISGRLYGALMASFGRLENGYPSAFGDPGLKDSG
jgi:hypothetical protein